jgi:hypothetical protein
MFSGLSLEGCERFNPTCCQYASKLEAVMPQGKSLGFQSEAREAEDHSDKASPATRMSQVGKDWESCLYKHAHDWQHQALPADVKEHLAGLEEMVGKVDENKWFSLVQFKSAWQM